MLEYAIQKKARPPYSTRVFVDGIDHKKAMELTNALRARGVSLDRVKSRRDESEPLIRLADMWAGCIRAAQLGRQAEFDLLNQARQDGYLEELPKQKTPQE